MHVPPAPAPLAYDVPGGTLRAQRFGTGPRTVLAAHGITGSSMSWPSVATALPPEWSVVAVDLRGRGASRDLPGPFGFRTHAADLHAVAERLIADTGDGVVLAGHSMGAYVAVHAVHQRPELFHRLVLVDGGVPLPFPEGADPDEVLLTTLGPAIERLSMTYPSADAYVEYFRRHPALGPHWNQAVEDYVRYDALEVPDGVRSRVREAAVRTDGRELLAGGDEVDAALRGITVPTTLLAAPAGMFGEPPGLLPADAVSAYGRELAHVSAETVPETNHYTILFDPAAATVVAHAITEVR